MKIVQIIDSLSPGGAERMAINLAFAFREAEITSLLVVSRKMGIQISRVPSGVPLVGLDKSNFFDLNAFLKLWKIIRNFNPDILHAHSTSLFWAVIIKFFYPKLTLIWHDHYGLADQLKSNDRKAVKWVVNWVDGIIVVNYKLKKWLTTETSYQEERIRMIPNFPVLSKSFQSKMSLSEPIVLLHIANFRRQKNHFVSLKALKWLHQHSTKCFELWLVGEDKLDLDYTSEIRDFIFSNNMTDEVRLIGGETEVELFLDKANVGLLSSDSEGLPVSLLEYGLARLPVVVTHVGDCAMVLDQGDLGKLVEPNKPEEFGMAILDLVENYEMALEMGESLRFKVENEYGPQGFISTYQEFLSSLS